MCVLYPYARRHYLHVPQGKDAAPLHAAQVTLRGYLRAMDIAMRERMPASAIVFDAARATWNLGRHEIRVVAMKDRTIRFELYTIEPGETLVGSYSGTVGATTKKEIVQYLVYFLETGKPWHHGLPNRMLT
jgi:hypothetical protein